MSIDPHRDRTMASVSLLTNLEKSRVQHLKHKQGESDYVSIATKYPKKHCLDLFHLPTLIHNSFIH